jgi:hypothetical protein
MPQFDTFSFFSQLFWVFFGFNFLYLSFCYYILPALSITLKIRAKKISDTNNSNSIMDLASPQLSFDESVHVQNFSSILTGKLSGAAASNLSLAKSNQITFLYNVSDFRNVAFRNFRLSLLKRCNSIALFKL